MMGGHLYRGMHGYWNENSTLWKYDTENHTENFCDTEKTWKPHRNIFTKEITVKIQDHLTEIFSFIVQVHWNHTEKFAALLISFAPRVFSVTLDFQWDFQCHNFIVVMGIH